MAWPFSGNSGGSKSADQNLSEERLKILANVAIEQVPFPEQGMLTEEDAWTISPGQPGLGSTASKACQTWLQRLLQPLLQRRLPMQLWTPLVSSDSSAIASTWSRMSCAWWNTDSMRA